MRHNLLAVGGLWRESQNARPTRKEQVRPKTMQALPVKREARLRLEWRRGLTLGRGVL
jgi:hypothetical protein